MMVQRTVDSWEYLFPNIGEVSHCNHCWTWRRKPTPGTTGWLAGSISVWPTCYSYNVIMLYNNKHHQSTLSQLCNVQCSTVRRWDQQFCKRLANCLLKFQSFVTCCNGKNIASLFRWLERKPSNQKLICQYLGQPHHFRYYWAFLNWMNCTNITSDWGTQDILFKEHVPTARSNKI